MSYHQKQYPFYNPILTRLVIGSNSLVVNYVDMLDESCVEFSHTHMDCYEVYYCLRGTHHLVVEDETYTLTEDRFALLRPGVCHHTVYEPQTAKQYVVFVFTKPVALASMDKVRTAHADDSFLSDALQYFDTHTHFIGKGTQQCRMILRNLHKEITGNSCGKKLMIDALYQQYIVTILRRLTEARPVARTPLPLSNLNTAVMITKYMHKNYDKNITIQDIADEFYISTRHVNRVFESYFGQSFKKALNIYRLNYAKNYMMDTDYSIEKISRLVGLASPSVLYQLFKEVEGMTVSEFCATIPHRKKMAQKKKRNPPQQSSE